MRSLLGVLVFYTLLLLSVSSNASQDASLLKALSAHPTWMKLTHINNTNESLSTDIVIGDFHLSSSGIDPLDEITKTLAALVAPVGVSDEHAQCAYPARSMWLQQMIVGLELPKVECPALTKWMNEMVGRQFHLVHVSGYFSNPASTFGHLLLRVGDGKTQRGLNDTGINFGARIPETDGNVSYILKGLTGGYTAAFSSKEHYLQDRIYAGTESRDMWAYELNLSADQRKMLAYHLWELKDKRFNYYFLRKNCGYRIAELLELVLDAELIKNTDITYAPVKLFNRLHDYDSDVENKLIRKIAFIPSDKRSSIDAYRDLSSEQAELAELVLDTGVLNKKPDLLSTSAIDFLLDYIDFKSQIIEADEKEEYVALKKQVLKLRFKHPAKKNRSIIALEEPGSGPRPGMTRVSVSSSNELELEMSPFWYGVKDRNRGSMFESSFKSLGVLLSHSDGELKFKKLTVLEIQSFAPPTVRFFEKFPFSWQAGSAIVNKDSCNCIDGTLYGAFGFSRRMGSNTIALARLNSEVTTSFKERDAGITFGLLSHLSPRLTAHWKTRFTLYDKQNSQSDWSNVLELRWLLNRDHAIDTTWSYDQKSHLKIGYRYKW